jgi:hypothetical protein
LAIKQQSGDFSEPAGAHGYDKTQGCSNEKPDSRGRTITDRGLDAVVQGHSFRTKQFSGPMKVNSSHHHKKITDRAGMADFLEETLQLRMEVRMVLFVIHSEQALL